MVPKATQLMWTTEFRRVRSKIVEAGIEGYLFRKKQNKKLDSLKSLVMRDGVHQETISRV